MKYRIFNYIICFLLLILFVFSFQADAKIQLPVPTTYKYVNDYTSLLNKNEIDSILSIGKELEDKTSAQAIVVVINSTNNIPIEDYSINLFRTWGIGQKGKDNGLLILLAVNDRKWRVEVGRGLEGSIPDVLSNRIVESVGKPKFIEGKYGEGLVNSYSALCDCIAKEYNITLEKSLNVSVPAQTTSPANNTYVKILGGIIVAALILDIVLNRGRFSFSILQLIFLSNIFRGHGPRGGSSGGGFGGFGGGSSGGGGSGGSW